MKSNLLDNLFINGQLDSYCKPNTTLKNYLNKLVLLDGVPHSNKIDDDINILGIKTATSVTTSDDGSIELTFDWDEEEEFNDVEAICLAPNCFQDLTSSTYSVGSLLNTDRNIMEAFIKFKKYASVDFDNNVIYQFDWDDLGNMKSTSAWNITLRKYFHDFKAIPFTDNDWGNMKLLESTVIDLHSIINASGISANNFMDWTFDDKNKKLIFIYFNVSKKSFNTCIIPIEDTSKTQMYNMTLPNEFTCKVVYNSNYKMAELANHDGRILLFGTISDDEGVRTGYFGFNPKNSTDYIEYESNYITTLSSIDRDLMLHDPDCSTTKATHVYLKNDIANISTNAFDAGFYYNSKIIYLGYGTNGTYYYPYMRYRLVNDEVTAINELSKPLYKKAGKAFRVKYKLTQEDNYEI